MAKLKLHITMNNQNVLNETPTFPRGFGTLMQVVKEDPRIYLNNSTCVTIVTKLAYPLQQSFSINNSVCATTIEGLISK